MIILGIETSCDETGAAVLEGNPSTSSGRVTILSNVVASSAKLQAKYGGIIPEQAAREQIKSITPVVEEALRQAGLIRHPELGSGSTWIPDQVRNDNGSIPSIDAIAVTFGPGLIGSLLVGVETAKTLALVWNKPLIPINHLIGHFYANWIIPSSLRGAIATKQSSTSNNQIATGPSDPRNDGFGTPIFPCLGLLVSGGHTDLVLFTNHGKYKYLGGTRDDAAGECFDKCARLLGHPYPGGPEISKLAQKGNPKAFDLPRPMINSDDFDFSFSGLKTAVSNLVKASSVIPAKAGIHTNNDLWIPDQVGDDNRKFFDLAASIEQAIVDVLVKKTIRAAQKYKISQIMIAGGVAANEKLVDRLQVSVNSMNPEIKLHIPPANLCTDNAAMIAAAGFFEKKRANPLTLQADPNLSLAY